MRNINFEITCTCGWETFRNFFFKIEIADVFGSMVYRFIQFVSIACQVEGYENILKLTYRPLAFTLCKAFLKNKKSSGTSFPASFSAWFLKKNIYPVIFYSPTNLYCPVAFTSWDIGQFLYRICLVTRLWGHKFWNSSDLSSQANFSVWPKSQDKNLSIFRPNL